MPQKQKISEIITTNIVLFFAFKRYTIRQLKKRYGFREHLFQDIKQKYKDALKDAIILCAEDLKNSRKNPYNHFYRCVWEKVYEYVKQNPYYHRFLIE